MIAVFLPPFAFRGVPAPYLWVFFKFLHTNKEKTVYIIGEEYLPKNIQDTSRWEFLEDSQKRLGYVIPQPQDLVQHELNFLHHDIFQKLLADNNWNPSETFRALLTQPIEPLINEVSKIFNQYENQLECVVTWCNCRSLSDAALTHGIPVVHLELGPLREPDYKPTMYVDFSGVNGNTEAKFRYESFFDVLKLKLSAAQLLDYFLAYNSITPPTILDDNEAKLGVVLQVEDDSNLIAFGNNFDNRALLSFAQLKSSADQLLVRAHPGSLFQVKDGGFQIDKSKNSLDFIQLCQKILTINSSVGLEALLQSKQVEILGECSYKFITETTDHQEKIDRLAFYLFAYLVPADLGFDFEYIRFRIMNKNENRIVEKHLNHYAKSSVVTNNESIKEMIESEMHAVQLKRFNGTIEELQQQISRLSVLAAEKESLLSTANQSLDEFTSAIHEYIEKIESINIMILERDASIEQLGMAIQQRDNVLEELERVLEQRNIQIDLLAQENITHKNDATRKTLSVLEENEALRVQLRNIKTEFDSFVVEDEALRAQMRDIKSEFEHSQHLLRASNAKVVGILHSTSWKVTSPLRVLKTQTSKLLSLGAPNKHKLKEAKRAPEAKQTRSVAVILPIYRDVEMTERCIRKAMPGILQVKNAVIYAINDCSPDPTMQSMLERVQEEFKSTLFIDQNNVNLGFVGTVNRGLERFRNHDVILLNSDVMVPNNWLQRLCEEAYSRPNIATVTPLSNNATVCSFPMTLTENSQAFGLSVDHIDSVFTSSYIDPVECPTGIGFCMYIRRDCLEQIGFLNTERFGRGYGEENDLCQRAVKAGWVNILTPNIYAFHEGAVSFSSDKTDLIVRAMDTLNEMHPNYHSDIHSFITHDPLKESRIIRYIQLLASLKIPKVLHVAHRHGGGVVQHIEELVTHYGNDVANLLLTPASGNGVQLQMRTEANADAMIFDLPLHFDKLIVLLRSVGVTAVHYHHTMEMSRQIIDIPSALGVPHILTVHDFYWLNGNPTLTNEHGIFDDFEYDHAVNNLFRLPPTYTPDSWRDSWRQLIETASVVIFPSVSTVRYFQSKFQITNHVVAPHVELDRDISRDPISTSFIDNHKIVIGVIGAIGKEKGADLLEALANKALAENSQFEFKLIGYAYRPLVNVPTSGRYKSSELSELITTNNIDVLFFPARWPETFSYTLSYALASRLPIIAPNLGAFPERLSGRKMTMLFQHQQSVDSIFSDISEFVDNLLNKGTAQSAPLFISELQNTAIYESGYIQIVVGNQNPSGITEISHLSELVNSPITRGSSLRRSALLFVCRVNASSRVSGLRNLIPISIRRKVRRLLEGPIHK